MNRFARWCGTWLSVVLTITCAYAQTSSNSLRGMAISPLMFRTEVRAGMKLQLPIEVQNLQADLLTLNVQIDPVTFDDWSYVPKFGSSHPNDCASWFTVRQMNRNVAPSTTSNIVLGGTIPRVRQGVYWCMARVTPHFQGDRSTIFAQYQIPIIMFIGHQARPTLELGSPKLVGTSESSQIAVPFTNTGEGFTVIGASVELRQTQFNRVVGTFYDSDRNLFPGSKRELVFSPGPLAKGEYTIISKPQAGTRSFAPITARFVVEKSGIRPSSGVETFEMSPVSLDPPALHVTMPGGAERSLVLRVLNNSSKPVSAHILVRTISQNKNGGFELGDTPPFGALSVTAEPESLELEAGRMGTVRLAIKGDKAASGDRWFGIAAKTQDAKEIAEEIYGSVAFPNGAPKLDLTQVDLKKVGTYPISLRYSIKNTGTLSLKPIAFAQVLEQGLTPIATLQIPTLGGGGILPGSVLENEVMLPPNLQPGVYTVNVKYQYGEDLFANLTVPITVGGKQPPKTAKKGGKSSGK